MKSKIFGIVVVIFLLGSLIMPVFAKLGQIMDVTTFTVQNVSSNTASITVNFVNESGTSYTPSMLDKGRTNPFDLDAGNTAEINPLGIPVTMLPSGTYAVNMTSSQQIISYATVTGQGLPSFNGVYDGIPVGYSTIYMPSTAFNYYGWYSMLTAQNVGNANTNVSIEIKCRQGGTPGSLSTNGLKPGASYTFDLTTTLPGNFTAAKVCDGSSKITSSGGVPIVAVDNMRHPTNGNTQSLSSMVSSVRLLYIPVLFVNYYGWNTNLNVRGIFSGSGSSTIEITFSDIVTKPTCTISDTSPLCSLYIPSVHSGGSNFFAAMVTSSNTNVPIVAVINASNSKQAQTYAAVTGGSSSVSIPTVYNNYYGWVSSVICQNVGASDVYMHIDYGPFKDYQGDHHTTPSVINPLKNIQFYQPNDAKSDTKPNGLPTGYKGSATITSSNANGDPVSGSITCIANFTNPTNISSANLGGDWSTSLNAGLPSGLYNFLPYIKR
jgi:hypothetical protein